MFTKLKINNIIEKLLLIQSIIKCYALIDFKISKCFIQIHLIFDPVSENLKGIGFKMIIMTY